MKKGKKFSLLFSLALLIVLGCNKDDSSNNNIPDAFEITISEITFSSAIVNWTVPATDEPTSITYSVYLNESLVVENLTETSYNLEDLNYATNYIMKVEAKNEYGTSTSSKEFTTLQPSLLRLISYDHVNYNFILEYDELDLLVYRGDPSPYGYTNIDFTYNQNNDILTEYSRYRDATANPSAQLTYEYSGTTLSGLTIHETAEDATADYEFQFNSPLNYNYTIISENLYGGPHISNYTVDLEMDNEGKVLKFTRTNLETSHIDRVYFEYINGNLTKIANGSNVLEITFDNANNWHTYRSGFLPYFYGHDARDLGGLIYFPNMVRWLNQIPQFYDFVNKNNALEYKFNGEVFTTFQYEYNQYNYPSKITIPQQNDTIVLEYEAVE